MSDFTTTPMSTPPMTTTPAKTINITNTIQNQNDSLTENLKHTENKNMAEQQMIYYQKLQTQYMTILNFYLFYLYCVMAIVFGYYWFFVKKGYTTSMKWFWYLHVLFLPYLLIYLEFATYYLLKFAYSWISTSPFLPWTNYTSYPQVF